MSKAVLILDKMPEYCDEHCRFCDSFFNCQFVGDVEEAYKNKQRDSKCPLKLMPEFEIVSKKELASNVKEVRLVKEGWNALIEKLSEEKYEDVVGYDEEIDDKIIKLASLVS